MADADCGICRLMGYRSCDVCSGPVFEPVAGALIDLCGYCQGDEPHQLTHRPLAA